MDKFVIRENEISELQSQLEGMSQLLTSMARTETSASELGEKAHNAMENFYDGLDQNRSKITENTANLASYLGTIRTETSNVDNELSSALTQDDSGESSAAAQSGESEQ